MPALVGGLALSVKSSTGETLACSAVVRNLESQMDKDCLGIHHKGPNTVVCLFLQLVIVIPEE